MFLICFYISLCNATYIEKEKTLVTTTKSNIYIDYRISQAVILIVSGCHGNRQVISCDMHEGWLPIKLKYKITIFRWMTSTKHSTKTLFRHRRTWGRKRWPRLTFVLSFLVPHDYDVNNDFMFILLPIHSTMNSFTFRKHWINIILGISLFNRIGIISW